MNRMMTFEATAELIRAGRALALAAPLEVLQALPAGRWIGGTTPYFMLREGGKVVREGHVFVTDLSDLGEVEVACYGDHELARLTECAPDNGFTFAIIPAGGRAHREYAKEAANLPDAFLKPTVGWIAGVHLDDLGRVPPLVFDGRACTGHVNHVVAAHVKLPAERCASLEIVNLFQPGDGDVLRFESTGFEVRDVLVRGERVAFAEYLRKTGLDHGRLPLVGDFTGAHVNVSLQSVGADGTVHLYAPVFPDIEYRFARPVADYAAAFRERLAGVDPQGLVLGCNCILNFVQGELEGKVIGGIEGPVTFGEIAYQLLNQTLVTLRVR